MLSFLPKKSKTLYSGYLIVAATFLGTAVVRYRPQLSAILFLGTAVVRSYPLFDCILF